MCERGNCPLCPMEKRFSFGKYNQAKGAWAECLIIRTMRHRACKNEEHFKSVTRNLPEDFSFVDYDSVWSYRSSPLEKRDIQIDVFARAQPGGYSVIGEVKCRDSAKFSLAEAERFLKKTRLLLEEETVGRYVGFVFSVSGFAKDAMEYMQKKKIAWSDDVSWMEG